MPYQSYTKEMLAEFSGRPAGSYTSYSTMALKQALMLWKIGTCIADPEALSDDAKELIDMAILSMADAIYLSQPFQEVIASPFSSESIGSYSYSKAAGAVSKGLPTGIGFFDIAVTELGMCDDGGTGDFGFGGIDIYATAYGDGALVRTARSSVLVYLTQADIDTSRGYGWDPTLALAR